MVETEEPSCIHTRARGPRQPMSRCRICKNSPRLAEWGLYWDSVAAGIIPHPDAEMVRNFRARGAYITPTGHLAFAEDERAAGLSGEGETSQ